MITRLGIELLRVVGAGADHDMRMVAGLDHDFRDLCEIGDPRSHLDGEVDQRLGLGVGLGRGAGRLTVSLPCVGEKGRARPPESE